MLVNAVVKVVLQYFNSTKLIVVYIFINPINRILYYAGFKVQTYGDLIRSFINILIDIFKAAGTRYNLNINIIVEITAKVR